MVWSACCLGKEVGERHGWAGHEVVIGGVAQGGTGWRA